MKKLLAVTMLSMSVFGTSVGYTQSLYEGGTYRVSESPSETDVRANAIVIPVLKWIFWGTVYYVFTKALDAAWAELTSWLRDQNEEGEPDLDDPRIKAVCDFVEKYKDKPETLELKDAVQGFCS